ncbi:MAG: MFS family permease [Planctomycetota bacterium]|jgi:MFS family permease
MLRKLNLTPDAKRYLIGSCVMGATFTIPFTLLVIYLDLKGMSKSQIGFVASGQPWGQVLATAPATYLLSRFSTRMILSVAALASGFLYALLPWMPSQSWLFAVNLAAGFAWSIHFTAGAPFLFRHSARAERPMLFSIAESSRMLASTVGAVAAGGLAFQLSRWLGDDLLGHAWALSSAGLFPIVATAAYLRISEKHVPREHTAPPWATFKKHHRLVLRFATPQLLIALGSGMTIPFMPLYFKEGFDFSTADVGVLFGGGQVLMSLGFLSAPFLMRVLGPVRAMMAVQLASIPFFLTLASANVAWIAAGAYLMRTAFMNASHPVMKTFLMEASPPGLRELQNALLLCLWGIGWVVGPLIGGAVLDASGGDYARLMYTTIGFYLVASVVMHFTLRPVERSLEE